MDPLTAERGFGRRDPVPEVIADGQTVVRASANPADNEAVFGDSSVSVMCRREGQHWLSSRACLECPGLVGLRRKSNKAPKYLPFEIECKWPEVRPVGFVPGPTNERVAAAVMQNGGPPLTRETFASQDRQAVVNCPRSRKATGRWALLSPPCPVCDHYRGLRMERPGIFGCLLGRKSKGPFVLCANPKPCYVRGAASGADILEG